MTVFEKLANARQQIANTKMEKAGKNTFSNYNYFTPEQVQQLVEKANESCWLISLFSLDRNEFWEYGVLEVVDIETWEKITVKWATAIPEIKATNLAQQIWGAMTYTNRYLLQLTYWIADNTLDFDTTENTMKTVGAEIPKMTDTQFANFKKVKGQYANWDEAVKIAKTKYLVDDVMEGKIRALYEN